MAFNATVLRVLIASPGDTEDERCIFPEVLRKWNHDHAENKGVVLLPVGWETDAYATYQPGERPQGILNKDMVNHCDIVIAVFRARLGTSTGEFESGTVEEIEKSASERKPVAVYFAEKYDASLDTLDLDQFTKVREYKKRLQKEGITFAFRDSTHFGQLLREHLTPLVQKAVANTQLPNPGPIQSSPTLPVQYDDTNLGSTIHAYRQQMKSTPFRNDFFSLIRNSPNQTVLSIMLRMSKPFEVFESHEKDFLVDLATTLFNGFLYAPEESIVPEFYSDSVTVSVEESNERVYSFYAYKNGTVFVEHIFPHPPDQLMLRDIAGVYRHHTEKAVHALMFMIPASQLVAVGMKLSNWPDGGIVTEPLFQCTPPLKPGRGSHWETYEDPHGIDLHEFFRKFLFGALENNQYRHFEEAVRELDLQDWSFPNFPTTKVSPQADHISDQTQHQRADKSSENGFTDGIIGHLVKKPKSKFDRVF